MNRIVSAVMTLAVLFFAGSPAASGNAAGPADGGMFHGSGGQRAQKARPDRVVYLDSGSKEKEGKFMNPGDACYSLLDRDWITEDRCFSVRFRDGRFTFRTPYDGVLESGFTVSLPQPGGSGKPNLFLMGDLENPVLHEGEEWALHPADRIVYNPNGSEIFRLIKFWYGTGTLHADVLWVTENRLLVLDFVQGKAKEEPPPDGDAWKCRCGAVNRGGRFCPNCGSPRPEPQGKKEG